MSAQPTIQIQFSPQAQELLARVSDPRVALQAIRRGSDLANQSTIGVIQKSFLSYPKSGPTTPEGLRVITNRLRGSVRASKAVIDGDTVVSAIGSNVKYAGVHEFGFQGSVMVGGQIRKRRVFRDFLAKNGKATRRKVRVGDSYVTPHRRNVNIPARAPFRRGITRNLETIRQIVSQSIVKALQGQGGAA